MSFVQIKQYFVNVDYIKYIKRDKNNNNIEVVIRNTDIPSSDCWLHDLKIYIDEGTYKRIKEELITLKKLKRENEILKLHFQYQPPVVGSTGFKSAQKSFDKNNKNE